MDEISSFSAQSRIFQVALPIPLRTLFDYNAQSLAPNEADMIDIGQRVLVPFGQRTLIGIVCVIVRATTDSTSENSPNIKSIIKTFEHKTGFNHELITLTRWVSNYYQHPIGDTVIAALPPYLRQDNEITPESHWQHTVEGKGLSANNLKRSPKQQAIHRYLLEHTSLTNEDAKYHGFSSATLKALKNKGLIHKTALPTTESISKEVLKEEPKTLTKEQTLAVESLRFHNFQCYLLHGITGSGKTEVYLHLVARALQSGSQALVLVPEIGLSPQTVSRFRARFAVKIVELHSGVSDAQRAKNWLAARNGEASIIIGTRLAALCALNNPGLIIVDEEHDSSFKQQDSVRYSARDLCIYRAKQNNIPIVLGSATPSLESLKNALDGNYTHLVLRERATGVTPPDLSTIDICNQTLEAGLSHTALSALEACIQQGGQALVFQNRRGFAPMQLCHSCGWVAECQNCSANLTLHQRPRRLHCHHCDKRSGVYTHCPRCNSPDLDSRGIGTEQLEHSLTERFADYPIIRVDRDSTRSKSSLKEAFEKIQSGIPAILVGTQMLAKGHHFPNLNLVLIVDADQGFLNPDFRAMEKMGQLLIQVAGRAGRESKQGQVLIQSHSPDHPLLQLLLHRGYTAFARELLNQRAQSCLPPYWYAATFRAESKRADNAIELLTLIRNSYHNHFPPTPTLRILGPFPANMERVQDRYRYQLQFNASTRQELIHTISFLTQSIEQNALSKRVRWSIDVDPIEE